MSVAAIYARYSSDSQREESIEIQIEQCTAFIERHGWETGEIYADYALTGKNDNRPAFRQCMNDGLNGGYDILVFYKRDRFARKVLDSRKYKEDLQEKGVRIFSVREGESKPTPDGFLHEIMDEAFAEYYSLNLAVLIKDGIQKNAENCKASGVRKFGYGVDEDDRFVVDERQAEVVRGAFDAYEVVESANVVAETLNAKGYRTARGGKWNPNHVLRLLHDDAYTGVYRYAGHVVEGGMPAIIDRDQFFRVQATMDRKKRGKRRSVRNDYLLTAKLFCLECGHGMQGQSGTGKSKRKYTYYACISKGGCGLRIPSEKVEETVLDAVKDMLFDEKTLNAMIEAVMNYIETLPDNANAYKAERAQLFKRRDNLVNSIADGIPASSVRDALLACEERLAELDRLVAYEKFQKEQMANRDEVRNYLTRFVNKSDGSRERAQLLVDTFIDRVYVDEDCAVVLFQLGGEEETPELDKIQAIKERNANTPCSEGVRVRLLWWSIGGSNP